MKRQFGAITLARIVVAGTNAVLLILVARSMTVSMFGQFSAVFAGQTALALASSFGLAPFILRAYARKQHAAVRAALRLNLLTSLITALALSLLGYFTSRPETAFSLVLLGISLVLEKNSESRSSVWIAGGESRRPAQLLLLRALIALILFGVLAALGSDVLVAFGISRFFGSAFGCIMTLRLPVDENAPQMPLIAVLGKIRHLALSNAIGSLRQLDSAVVALTAGSSVAGLYTAASRLRSPIGLVAGAASTVIMPRSAQMTAAQARAFLRKVAAYLVVATIGLIPLSLLSGPSIRVVFGQSYEGAAAGFALMLVSIPSVAAVPILSTILQSRDFDSFVMKNTLVFTVASLLAIGGAASVGGPTLAAAAFLATSVLRTLALLLFAFRRIR